MLNIWYHITNPYANSEDEPSFNEIFSFKLFEVRENKLFSRIISNGFHCWYKPEKISFSLLRPYLQKPYANFSETNVVRPQTRLMCALTASLRPFSLLSDLLVIKMNLNFRTGD